MATMRRKRRSHSVNSTLPHHHSLEDLFLNKRDNPLFCSEDRGRSVRRNPDFATARVGRSVSRTHSHSEAEQDYVIPSSYPNQNVNLPANRTTKGGVNDNVADVHRETVKQSTELSVNSDSYSEGPWEDAVSTGFLTEAEENTIKAFYEQIKGDGVDGAVSLSPSNRIYETVRSEVKRAILDIQNDLENAVQRNNTHAMASTNVTDIPPDLVNPGAVELVSDIRKQYAKKLEESQERATKLRADLAVEEHRGQEFSRILKEIIPDPKTINVQKSQTGRKRSNERKNMSKRLTEEAMAYFDECVSISTFDGSDFSATEDHPPFNLVETASTPVGLTASFMPDSSSVPTSYCAKSFLNHYQDSSYGLFVNSNMDSGLIASSGSNEHVINKELGPKSRFSFSPKPTENGGLRQDVRSYIRNIEEEYVESCMNSENSRVKYNDMDLYIHADGDSALLEMVLSKSRMECGSLHLCGGGLGIMFSPFASII